MLHALPALAITSSVVLGPAALASPGSFSELQNLKPHPDLLHHTLQVEWDPQVICVHIKTSEAQFYLIESSQQTQVAPITINN